MWINCDSKSFFLKWVFSPNNQISIMERRVCVCDEKKNIVLRKMGLNQRSDWFVKFFDSFWTNSLIPLKILKLPLLPDLMQRPSLLLLTFMFNAWRKRTSSLMVKRSNDYFQNFSLLYFPFLFIDIFFYK